MQIDAIVLGHHIFSIGITLDPTKVEVIRNIPAPMSQKEVKSFLGHVGF